MKNVLMFFALFITSFTSAQSYVSYSFSHNPSFSYQHELGVEASFSPKIQLVLRIGSNFTGYNSYRMGARYEVAKIKKTRFVFGLDISQFHNYGKVTGTERTFRHLDILGGLSYAFSPKINGIFDIGINSKNHLQGVTPIFLRLGVAYRIR